LREGERDHGATAVFAVLEADNKDSTRVNVTVGHVGDSRAILVKSDGQCVDLTSDHRPKNNLERERILKANGTVSYARVDGDLAMSRAFGDWKYKDNPQLPITEQKVIAVPDVRDFVLETGDILILYCDGIVENLRNGDVAQFISEQKKDIPTDPALLASRLLDRSIQSGSQDNLTAIVIQMGDGSTYKGNEYLVGTCYREDKKFMEAWKDDVKRHGYVDEDLDKLIEANGSTSAQDKIEREKEAYRLMRQFNFG